MSNFNRESNPDILDVSSVYFPKVTRVEVIDENGRAYVKYLDKDREVSYSLQDDNRTLKVFIK